MKPTKTKTKQEKVGQNGSKTTEFEGAKTKVKTKKKVYKPKGTQRSIRGKLGTVNDLPKKMFKTTGKKEKKGNRSRSVKKLISKSNSQAKIQTKKLKIKLKSATNSDKSENKIFTFRKRNIASAKNPKKTSNTNN